MTFCVQLRYFLFERLWRLCGLLKSRFLDYVDLLVPVVVILTWWFLIPPLLDAVHHFTGPF